MGNIWLWLNNSHTDYSDTIAALNVVTNEAEGGKGTGRMVEVSDSLATITDTLGLSIGTDFTDLVLDIFHPDFLATPHARWSSLEATPTTLPTASEDRRIAYHRGLGSDTILYVGQDDNGDGSGDSYINRMQVKDILGQAGFATEDPDAYDLVIIAGRCSRFPGEGNQSKGLLSGSQIALSGGTSGSHQILASHPTDRAELMRGHKVGDGSWSTPSDWTVHSGDTYKIDLSGSSLLVQNEGKFCHTDDGGTLRALEAQTSAANVVSTPDSFWYDHANDIIYVHLASGNNPKNTTYVQCTSAHGITISPRGAAYLDIYGIKSYGASYNAAAIPKEHWDENNTDVKFYGVQFLEVGDFGFELLTSYFSLTTGQYTTLPKPIPNLTFHGCVFSYCSDAIYPASQGGDGMPKDWLVRDCWFFGTGKTFKGVTIERSDSHSIGSQGGAEGFQVLNNYFENCASRVINFYGWAGLGGNGHDDPDATITDAAFANGTFTSNINNWTQIAGTISHTSDNDGSMRFASGTSTARADAITLSAAYEQNVHILKFRAGYRMNVQIGTTAGGSDILASTRVGGSDGNLGSDLWYAVTFTPGIGNTTIHIDITNDDGVQTDLQDIAIVTNLVNEPVFSEGCLSPSNSYTQHANSGKGGKIFHFSPNTGIKINDNIFDGSWHTTVGSEDQLIHLAGDNAYWGYGGQIDTNIEVKRNRIKNMPSDIDVALRIKWRSSTGNASDIQVEDNIIEDPVETGLRVLNQWWDVSGNEVEPSFRFRGNTIRANTNYCLISPVAYPAGHELLLGDVVGEGNTYVGDENGDPTAVWVHGATSETTLSAWQAAAPTGDVFDDESELIAETVLASTMMMTGVGT